MKFGLTLKLMSLLCVLLICFVLVLVLQFNVSDHSSKLLTDIRDRVFPTLETVDRVIVNFSDLQESLHAAVGGNDEDEFDQAGDIAGDIVTNLVKIKKIDKQDSGEIDQLVQDFNSYSELAFNLSKGIVSGEKDFGSSFDEIENMDQRYVEFSQRLEKYRKTKYELYINSIKHAQNLSHKGTLWGVYRRVVFFLVVIGVGVMINRWVRLPIVRLAEASESLSKGNFQTVPALKQSDEIGSLSSQFNNMVVSIELGQKRMEALVESTRNIAKCYEATELLDSIGQALAKLTGKEFLFQLYVSHRHFVNEGLKEGFYNFSQGEKAEPRLQRHLEVQPFLRVFEQQGDKIMAILAIDEISTETFQEISRAMKVLATSIGNALSTIKLSKAMSVVQERELEIGSILDTIDQGIFMVGVDLVQEGPVSGRISHFTLEKDPQKILTGLLDSSDLSPDQQSQVIHSILFSVGAPSISFLANQHLLPREFNLVKPKEMIVEVDWIAMENEDVVDRLLISLRDVTGIRDMQKKVEASLEEVRVLNELINITNVEYSKFSNDMHRQLQNIHTIIETEDKDERLIKMTLHTLKGNSRLLGLTKIIDVVHQAEDTFFLRVKRSKDDVSSTSFSEDLEKIEAILNEYDFINYDKIGRPKLQDLEIIGGSTSFDYFLSGLEEYTASLARELGKLPPEVDISLDGYCLKNMYEGFFRDISNHIIRNAIDHGLPAEGQGKIGIKVAGEDDKFVDLCFWDSGRGLDLTKLRQKAAKEKLAASKMTDKEVAYLIFAADLSTRDKVSQVSGRGVGLEAVKSRVEAAKGRVEIQFLGDKDSEGFQRFELHILIPLDYFDLASEVLEPQTAV